MGGTGFPGARGLLDPGNAESVWFAHRLSMGHVVAMATGTLLESGVIKSSFSVCPRKVR